MERIDLDGSDWVMKEFVGLDWVWRDAEKADTRDCRWWNKATVPGSVLQDLWEAKKVADPYYECNSKLSEWVPQRTWLYKKEFATPQVLGDERITLCCKGIDYSALIYVNDKLIGRHVGQFIPFECDITEQLKSDGMNLLAIVLDPAPAEQPQVGRTSLVRTHKTRMNYWWDFCPRMIHQGIWDSVYLKITGQSLLKDVYLGAELSEDYSVAELTAEMEVEGEEACEVSLEVDGQIVLARCHDKKEVLKCVIRQPRLWQPNGYGEPYQYLVILRVKDSQGRVSDEKEFRFGIRKIEFIKNEGCHLEAPPFVLKVNGRRIYMNGYNWVPMDAMYGVERPNKLKRLIQLAKDANTVIFRVWGGGLIEKDSFYEACAENGILIWQEFIQSSSGIDNKPPEEPEFLRQMVCEVENIIKRKRNHTALAIWCGGNELSDTEGNPVKNSDPLISRLKEAVNRLDPKRRWLPSSPSGGVFSNSLANIAATPDLLWDVHGPWEHQGFEKHYELYNCGTSLLHSEFGVEGMTNRNTLLQSMSEKNLLPASKDNEVYFHRGAWWTNEPLLQEMFGGLTEIDQIRKASQYMQYEGLKYAVECNRRRAYQNSGTFPWQFNEPYPNNYCTSNVDYYANPKPAYYGVKNSYHNIMVSASFSSSRLEVGKEFNTKIFVTTNKSKPELLSLEKLTLCCEVIGSDGAIFYQSCERCILPMDCTEQKAEITLPPERLDTPLILLRLRLSRDEGEVIAENEYLFTTGRHLGAAFGEEEDDLGRKGDLCVRQEGDTLRLGNHGNHILWYLFLSCADPMPQKDFLYFERNYFCLVPGEERLVHITSDSGTISGKSLQLESFRSFDRIRLQ